jgi:hypothetical protein
MTNLRFFFLLIFINIVAYGSDWNNLHWKSGQILGISSRAGLTPVLVQMGTKSRVDHVGIVSVEKDGPWLYEFTNATGIQKVPISEVWIRSADLLGKVHYILGEFVTPLTKEQWELITLRLEKWVLKLDSNPPRNCLETVLMSIQGINSFHVKTTNLSPFISLALNGNIEKIIRKSYPNQIDFPIISSIFENLIRVDSNLPQNLLYSTETSFIQDWKDNGDLSKFVRSIFLHSKEKLLASEIENKNLSLSRQLEIERVSIEGRNSCLLFYSLNSNSRNF